MTDAVLTLPESLRDALKEPLGEVYTDADELLAAAGVAEYDAPLVTVGDVVTAHLLDAGHAPAVAIVDRRTKRAAIDPGVERSLDEARTHTFGTVVEVTNPAATLTRDLLDALAAAVERAPETTMIVVHGEEDLAALPAILALPDGGHAVYGQPDEGMVLVPADAETRERATSILERMDGEVDVVLDVLST